ncbi:MAG: hypothetical protein ACM3YE_17350 [Bacteroidota bacterium]
MNAGSSTELTPARFPDIYYQVQPVIQNTICEMDNIYMTYPSQEALDQMVDRACEEYFRMYPNTVELEESLADPGEAIVETQVGFGRPRLGRPFRRRGLFRDLVSILLLSELFRRRGHYY